MELEYVIADPTGNITALVLTPVPARAQPVIAAALMARETDVEQAGFLTMTGHGARLRMAGGEFCGNAAMSAGAVYASGLGLGVGEKLTMPLRVSGVPESVNVAVEVLPDGCFSGEVDMPLVRHIGRRTLWLDGKSYYLPIVWLPGITHVIAPGDMDRDCAERAARKWCAELGASALGLMLLDREKRSLKPLVYVPGADTLFWESSCASGTAAVGVWMSAMKVKPCRMTLSEPGGCLSVEADFFKQVLRLSGHVRLRGRKIPEAGEN